MDWLKALLGPYPDVPPAALVLPLLLAILWAVNSNPKEANRKGWHPLTKWVTGFFAVFLLAVGVIWIIR